jgi:hypothetical protein
MSKVRKPHNLKARMERAARALLKTNHAAVACIEPGNQQVMISWKHCRQIRSIPVANALCDIAHRWTVYISVFCQMPDGTQYSKSTEFSTVGMHLVASLDDTMEARHAELVAQANPNHTIGSGWIAIPDEVSLDEAQANRVFKAMGAWPDKKAA